MYQRGDIVFITEKANPKNYMLGLIIQVYDTGIYVISLDQGTFTADRFKKYKKLGIKYGKYIKFYKYNIHINKHIDPYYSVDYTNRTLDRKCKHITYKIKTEYYEYVAGYTDLNNKNKIISYVQINKKASNSQRTETSGGLFIAPYSTYANNENLIINKARARAEVNLYKQFNPGDE